MPVAQSNMLNVAKHVRLEPWCICHILLFIRVLNALLLNGPSSPPGLLTTSVALADLPSPPGASQYPWQVFSLHQYPWQIYPHHQGLLSTPGRSSHYISIPGRSTLTTRGFSVPLAGLLTTSVSLADLPSPPGASQYPWQVFSLHQYPWQIYPHHQGLLSTPGRSSHYISSPGRSTCKT